MPQTAVGLVRREGGNNTTVAPLEPTGGSFGEGNGHPRAEGKNAIRNVNAGAPGR